ncbi:MAG: hypothetical protein PHI63_02890 [Patescibacteria group bacterium]|nr:hypothetical protein [Patescibacteria group bacterium]
MLFLHTTWGWWISGYAVIGLVVANTLRLGSRHLDARTPLDIPAWVKTFFPLHVNFRYSGDPDTYGTVFWNRSALRTLLGIAVVTAVWPLRMSGSLFGWLIICLSDGCAAACGCGDRTVQSRFP